MFTLAFWISATLAILGLVCTYRAGRARQRRRHVGMAVASVLTLAVAIVFAELMARERDFPRDIMRIHLVFAKSGALLVVPVIVTGVLLLRRPALRRWHVVAVWLFLSLAAAATATGVWAFSQSSAREVR